jgi:hypothetical protein
LEGDLGGAILTTPRGRPIAGKKLDIETIGVLTASGRHVAHQLETGRRNWRCEARNAIREEMSASLLAMVTSS